MQLHIMPEYHRLEMLCLKQTHKIRLRSQVVLLTHVCEENYILPKGTVFCVHVLDSESIIIILNGWTL